ncbi:mitochondrial 54S ribosomal protein YmL16 [Aaosphaeria arxii CBS 175.79]|uniref:Mitochondrial 54S ribosomal protein YmL16 n=1 Tax=Aaosphaeria arxii CBS 175.79 TaxID=1450172 RepID=A0A6A5Y6G1_9PLEO|nr:mitochondrial 54S ribosomal protein YmL16 [Aaosphaeria arxii CBS 175.79]KAF2020879.1 mitochondrial 54S ribosomal protein YmL16 [Aaosphaeria arxii CBS 175.79]
MLTPIRRRGALCASTIIQTSESIPSFLLPAFQPARTFATTSPRLSKIGSLPLSIPPEVSFKVVAPSLGGGRGNGNGNKGGVRTQAMSTVHIKGPLGELSMDIPSYVKIDQDPSLLGPTLSIEDAKDAKQRAMWGTTRAYLQNHILGVSEGHSAILRLVGVGYRASVETTATTVESEYAGQQFVNLKVGYSHPVELGIPKGVKASTPQPTRLLLEGAEKEVVMQFAAKIRKWRVPEPYKGKGIFVNDETIKLKNKKIK